MNRFDVQQKLAAASLDGEARGFRRGVAAAAEKARTVVGGFTANIRASADEPELIRDPDGPWVLNGDVADAILSLPQPREPENPWSADEPEVPGYYWCREAVPDSDEFILEMLRGALDDEPYLMIDGARTEFAEIAGTWEYQPVVPPREPGEKEG